MPSRSQPWRLTKKEWRDLEPLLAPPAEAVSPGRPRLENVKPIAEACLYRHHHKCSSRYRTFGWNLLPKDFGVSPSTANRRFREWTADGRWNLFWHGLLAIRGEGACDPADAEPVPGAHVTRAGVDAETLELTRLRPEEWVVGRTLDRFPVSDILAEIERAYLFFNSYFFGNKLPSRMGLSLERYRPGRIAGYFCARLWKHGRRVLDHIALHVSVIGQGTETAMEVLLHEMVHLRNNQVGISDCDPRNQYHNRYFRDLAALAGLACPVRNKARGYFNTELNTEGLDAVAKLELRANLFRWKVK